jgi:hypothetical protein
MGIRQIKAALQRIENEGGDTRRLFLAVPTKRGIFTRNEVIRAIARQRGESEEEVRYTFRGDPVGVIIRAESYDSQPMEADLAFLGPSLYETTGNIVYPSPGDLRWSESRIVDDNGELFGLDRLDDAVNSILYGYDNHTPSGRPEGDPYYEPRSRRY